jgi:hypothetical protein
MPAGDSGSLNVTVTDQACAWVATSDASWLTVTSGGTGTGNGTISWSVAENSAAGRSATISAEGAVFAVTQAGCTLTINPVAANFTAAGGVTSVDITASTPSCAWTATSPAGWVTVNPASGAGNATVTISAAPNSNGARAAGLTIAGQAVSVTESGTVITGPTISGTTVGSGTSLRGVAIQ